MRIYIYDTNGNAVIDTEARRTLDYATGLSFSSVYPKGYDSCTFKVRRRDIFAGYAIKESYTVLVRDGGRLVWDGFVTKLNYATGGGDESITVTAAGWYAVLNQRLIAKRWIDPVAINHLIDAGNGSQTAPVFAPKITKRGTTLSINCTTDPALDLVYDDAYHLELYKQPGPGHYIRSASYNYRHRNGQTIYIQLYNIATSTTDDSHTINSVTVATGSHSGSITGDTESIYLRLITGDLQYDYNDWVDIIDLVVYSHYESGHRAWASPAYTLVELVEDCVLIANRGSQTLSEDFSQLADITTAIEAFTVESPTAIGSVIDKICAYSNTNYETICFSVWGRDGTTENLPRCVLDIWDNSAADYVVSIDSQTLDALQTNKETGDIYNYIIVQYVDEQGNTQYLYPETESDLEDAASQARYMRREKVLKIGKATEANAAAVGARYLQYHKDARYRGSISVTGYLQNAGGGVTPAAWVRAGQRVYVPELATVFVLRSVSYDAETNSVTITPDLPPDKTDFVIEELKRQADDTKPQYDGVG